MGYFDGIANLYFKKDSGGKTVFYPWGVIAKGYTLPDEAREAKARGFIKLHTMVTLPAVVISVSSGWIWLFITAAVLYGWFFFKAKALVQGCPPSLEKLSFKESYDNSAKGHNKGVLWLLLIISLFFVAAGLWLIFHGTIDSGVFPLVLSCLFFGGCSFAIGYMIKSKGKGA